MAWTEEVKHAKSGDYEVNLYDDNGYSAMKRVLERGDDASSVKPLVTIMVNHPVSCTPYEKEKFALTQCRNYVLNFMKTMTEEVATRIVVDFTK